MELPDLSAALPWVQQISFGAVAGFVAGYALKKIGKLVAVIIGVIFIIIQLLAWTGFLSVNWGVVQEAVEPLLETESLDSAWNGLLRILTYNIPFAAAFVPAFILGVRRG